jgi:transcriptional regulator ATRX
LTFLQVNHHVQNNILRHPDLGVPVCRSCKYFYEDEGEWEKDEQGSDCYCRWCANGGDLICCDKCTNAFCKRCIQRNLGRATFAKINECEKWECFMCDPTPVFPQR